MTDLHRLMYECSWLPTVLVSLEPDDRGRVVELNPAAEELFGAAREARTLADLLGHDRPLTEKTAQAGRFDAVIGPHHLEAHFVELPATPLVLLLQFVDVTARVARERDLAHRAERDPLTGILNRVGVEAVLQQVLSEWHDSTAPGAVFFCDLNRFKQINDTFGHLIGDRVMRRVADRITSTVRRTDPVGRYGGDEFVVVLPRIKAEDAARTARRLVRSISEPIVIAGTTTNVGVCIGVVILDGVSSMIDVIAHADAAMYQAKSGGGEDRFVIRHLRSS